MNTLAEKILSVTMIVIGDEILNGRTQDLNASWLSKFLFKKGMDLKSVRFIRDHVDEISTSIKEALSESDIVITSGGIGPTLDDKTKSVLANYFKKQIKPREDVAEIVTNNYIRFGRVWNRESNFYHHFPEDFFAISNPLGLAPGLGFFTNDQKLIISAPGVPREFKEMVDKEFYPIIKKKFSTRLKENFQSVIRTHNIPEEKIFYELCPGLWKDLEAVGKVSSLPNSLGIDIVVSYLGNEDLFLLNEKKIKAIVSQTPLLPYVWHWGNQSLGDLILQKAKNKKCTFSFAESCTGGLTSSKITDLSGSSEVFWGSLISYDNSIKENILGVKSETLKDFGAVSIETAKEMAINARKLFKTDYAISISGITGPTGGTIEKPVGTVAIGFSTPLENGATLYLFPGDRIKLKDRFSEKALLTLLELMK
jgi:nicotinamide-nucleotide amidase